MRTLPPPPPPASQPPRRPPHSNPLTSTISTSDLMRVQMRICEADDTRIHRGFDLNLSKRKTSPKPLSSSLNPSSTFFSFKYESFSRKNLNSYPQNDEYRENFSLPLGIDHSGSVSRYLWDGEELRLASVGGNNAFSLRDCITVSVRDFFLPRQVSHNYLEYVKWKFLHRVSSSALQVLATQAMFRAIGLGYSRSLPSAAALNWVLKDGLGRLSRCIYTASLASSFDTNLKRVRFSTSLLFSLSIGIELLTPTFPKFFLLLATIANIAKQISLACYLATGTAVHRSFAISDNLGEVSAKSQIQTVCFDNIGLLLAATINILFRNNQRFLAVLPFFVYPIFCGLDLLGIYQGLKHVHLQTLTKDRLVMIMDSWLQSGYVPSPAEVSKREGIDFLWSKGRDLLPMRIGCINPKRKIPKVSLLTLRSVKGEDMYFVCLESLNGGSRISDHGILVSLREGAMTSDVIMGLMQSCYIRKGLLLDISDSENSSEPFGDSLDCISMKWLKLIEDSKRRLRNDVAVLNNEMSKQEWACKNILLSTQEQARYVYFYY